MLSNKVSLNLQDQNKQNEDISIDFFPEAILEDMLANRLLGGSFAND
jgi:hypothetical protein